MRTVFAIFIAVIVGWALAASAAESGSSVIVIYNSSMPESKEVALYYTAKRAVPTNQLFGFRLSKEESMTRAEFLERLQNPLLKELESRGIFKLARAGQESTGRRVSESSIRYAALCYGVPIKIARDDSFSEKAIADQLPAELRRNEASVDSQLTLLPMSELNPRWVGTVDNPFYAATNAARLHPTNGILMVTRLDGPTPEIARGLVDKALLAERDGLWGRAYFDMRNITNGGYKAGDDMMRGASNVTRKLGFETVVDIRPETFPASFPMSQIAFYAGWYDWNASGPFTLPQVEFMPGAFAYHLHSFSAKTIRSTTEHWVGPLLAKGATATMGCVDEPYLAITPDMSVFFSRFTYLQFSFGEAAWASQIALSWQNIAVGDPLYRPFAKKGRELHEELERRQAKIVEWSHLMIVDLNLNLDPDPKEAIKYLEDLPLTRQSAVLTEKLGDLYWDSKKMSDAIDTYAEALKRGPSRQQRIRLQLTLAEKRQMYGHDEAALAVYHEFLKENPEYPDLLSIYKKVLPLAERLEKKAEVERFQREIKRLTEAVPSRQKS